MPRQFYLADGAQSSRREGGCSILTLRITLRNFIYRVAKAHSLIRWTIWRGMSWMCRQYIIMIIAIALVFNGLS
jgi:hypothetical protein